MAEFQAPRRRLPARLHKRKAPIAVSVSAFPAWAAHVQPQTDTGSDPGFAASSNALICKLPVSKVVMRMQGAEAAKSPVQCLPLQEPFCFLA